MTKVRKIMTPDVAVLTPHMTMRDALELLWERQVAGAPVVHGSQVVGVVSTTDLLEFEATTPAIPSFRESQADWGDWTDADAWQEGASPPLYFVELWRDAETDTVERMAEVAGPEWDFLRDHTIEEAMSRKLMSVSPDDDVRVAARRMTDADIHRLLVLEHGRMVGILSASDIVRAVAEGAFSVNPAD